MDNNSELKYRIALASLKGVSVEFARIIHARFGSLEEFFSTPAKTVAAVLGMNARIFDDSVREQALEKAKGEALWIENNGVKPLYFTDNAFPARLTDCSDAPLILFSLGDTNLNASHIISIVGTRHATLYGTGFIKSLVADISQRLPDTVVVSGLAFGCDVAAHNEALANNIPTTAVLGHGLATIYPAVHRSVAVEMLAKGGSLITEYCHDAPVHRGNFLARNRIVAGLCDALIVVESAEKGGAIVTANIASAYNRDVFAVPGRVSDTYSRGCNNLIYRQIATTITSADNLFESMRWEPLHSEGKQSELSLELTPEEKEIVEYLTHHGEAYLNKMTIDLNKQMPRMIQLLGAMEFNGIVVNHPGGKYTLA